MLLQGTPTLVQLLQHTELFLQAKEIVFTVLLIPWKCALQYAIFHGFWGENKYSHVKSSTWPEWSDGVSLCHENILYDWDWQRNMSVWIKSLKNYSESNGVWKVCQDKCASQRKHSPQTIFHLLSELSFSTFPPCWSWGRVCILNVSGKGCVSVDKHSVKMGPCDKTGFPISRSWMGEPRSFCLTKPECEAQIVPPFIIKMCGAHIKRTSHSLRCHMSSTCRRLMLCSPAALVEAVGGTTSHFFKAYCGYHFL